MNVEKEKTMVHDLMILKDRLDMIILKCFQSNENYIQAEKDAFNYFINKRANVLAELLGKFLILIYLI